MTSQGLLDLSAGLEPMLWATALVVALLLVGRTFVRAPHHTPTSASRGHLDGGRERRLLLAILVVATLVRVVGWRSGLTPSYYFADMNLTYAAELVDRAAAWREYVTLHATGNVSQVDQSAPMFIVAAALHTLLGPSLHLSVLVGAVYGISTVLLAWWVGRTIESRVFGLLFAAFVCVSPLQITWSRLGFMAIAAVPHVLVVVALGFFAGRRASVPLALLAALGAWSTYYQYYAARIAIPLAFVAMGLGLVARRARNAEILTVFGIAGAAFAGLYGVIRPPGMIDHGWLGSEPLLAKAVRNLPLALRAYFWEQRVTAMSGTATVAGMANGGLVLAAVAILGLIGGIRCLAAPAERGLWLVLAPAALVGAVLSAVTARRLLVFDLAWCALAAQGVLALLDSRPLRTISSRLAGVLTGALLLAIAAWSVATVLLLNHGLSRRADTPIPFGESGIGDGRTCIACRQTAERWARDIGTGGVVVLFESDVDPENTMMPIGLPLYGEIAAIAAGRKGSFIDFYAVLENDHRVPSHAGRLYDPGVDFASFLAGRIEQATPGDIVWDFQTPTAWELGLVTRLEEAGGRRRPLAVPGSDESTGTGRRPADPSTLGEALVVVTPWQRRRAALEIFHDLARQARSSPRACARLEEAATRALNGPALVIGDGSDAGEPEWIVATGSQVHFGDESVAGSDVAGIAHAPTGTGVELLDVRGSYVVRDPVGGDGAHGVLPTGWPIGRGCAVRLADGWWAIDPASGALFAQSRGVVESGDRWVGITRRSPDELVLASARELVVFDAARGVETARFPATVWPSRRVHSRDCGLIVAGEDFFGTVAAPLGSLHLYARDGRPQATIDLDLHGGRAYAARAAGRFLALGVDAELRSARVTLEPGCRQGAGRPRGASGEVAAP